MMRAEVVARHVALRREAQRVQLNGGRFSIDAIEPSSPFAEAIHDFYVLKLDERADGLNDERARELAAAHRACSSDAIGEHALRSLKRCLGEGVLAQLRPLDRPRDGPSTRGDGLNTLLRGFGMALMSERCA